MNWDDLQPFLALIREGSLSGAARALRVEHATIARRMDRLESALGLRLFDRLPRGWRPTAEGQALVARAEAVEASLFDLRRQASGGTEGPVRLSVPPLLAAEVLTPRLGPFLAENPGVQLVLDADPYRADLGRGEIDLALRIGPVSGQTLRMRRLGDVIYRPYGRDPKGGVIRTRDAGSETGRWMAAWSGPRPVVLEAGDPWVMRAAARAGLGIALLPEFLAGDLEPVGPEKLSRPLHLTLHEDKARAPRVRLVADEIADLFTEWFRDSRTPRGAL
jgi:DNA-binding transcriptional LysR family regulator